MKLLQIAITIVLLSSLGNAQGFSGLAGTVTPSSAQPGQMITLTITAYGASQGFSALGSNFVIREIYQDSPAGNCVFCPFGFTTPITLNAGQSMSSVWDQTDDMGNQVPAGDYYLKVTTWGSATYFHARIEDPATPRPTLSELAPAQIGQPYLMGISSPATPMATYITAASFTTNSGTTITPSEHLSLDMDALFGLTFPMPNTSLFSNLQGTLDATGSNLGLGMYIPFVPSLADVGLKFQAAVIDATGIQMTNTLSVTIQ